MKERRIYLFVSLLISLVFWAAVLSRRDFVYTKSLDLDLQVGPHRTILAQTADRVKIRVSGPRASLKKWVESANLQNIVVDLTDRPDGIVEIDVSSMRIDLPIGVRVLGIKPNLVRAEIITERVVK